MLDYQLEERGRWREAIRAKVDVEFLEDQDAQPELLEPDDRMDGRRWRTRAAMIGLAAMVLIAGVAIHGGAGLRAEKASPNVTHSAAASRLRCGGIVRVPVGDLPIAISVTATRALAGIRITDAVARAACPVDESRDPQFRVIGAPPWLLTRSFDARYKQLLIRVEISPGIPSSRTTTQTVANQPSKVDIIHDQRQSARRTVTVTVTAPQRAAIPVRRLHRMADQLSRLSGSERMESTALLRCAADLRTAANLFICK